MKRKGFLILIVLVLCTLALLPAPPPVAQAQGNARFNTYISPAEFNRSQVALRDWIATHPAQVNGTPTTASRAMQNVAAWTFMVYIGADNDLEPFSLEDINELELIGSTTDVNIVVQMDRAAGYATEDGDWTDARRFFVTQDQNFDSVTSQVVQSLGETNHGDPATLVDFATWAMQTFPAQRYALILWDHGGGWTSFAPDDSAGGDALTMTEIDAALAQITGTVGASFEVIGFDACLMAQLEVQEVLAPYARYAIAAEETIPGNGWFYRAFMETLVNDPGMDGAALGQAIVDSYMQFYNEVVTYYDVFDLNVFDLAQIDPVRDAIGGFASAVEANAAAVLSAIGDARNNAQVFGGSTNPDEADYFSSTDLIHFLELLTTLSTNDAVNQAAQAVIQAAEDMTLYHQANAGLPGARGLAIFFPRNPRVYSQYGLDQLYPQQVSANLADWQTFLSVFYGTAVETLPPPDSTTGPIVAIQGVYPSGTVSIHEPPVAVFELDGRDIAEVSFSATLQLEDGYQIMLDYSPLESAVVLASGEEVVDFPDGVSQHEFTWGVEMPVITDGQVYVDTLLLSNPSTPDSVAVSGTYFFQDGQEVPAYVIFDLETRAMTSVWGLEEAQTGAAPFEIYVTPGDHFLPTWRFLDQNNEFVLEPANRDPLTFSDTPFTFEFAPADSGTYLFTIVVEDIAGNLYADSATITVNNEGLDPNYRGFTDVEFGLSFLYPWDWTTPTVYEQEDGGSQIVISDLDGNINIYVMAYDATSSDEMLEIGTDYVNSIQNVVPQPAEAAVAGGYNGHIIPYDFTLDDGQARVGATLTVYVPDTQTGYLIDLDALASMIDEGSSVFTTMLESLTFFTPPQIGTPAAGDVLDFTADPNYGTVSLSAGFLPDPTTVAVTGGGDVDANALGVPGCYGFASRAPDVRLQWSGQSNGLRVFFVGDGDTVLLVNDASGQWHCNDDSAGTLNPMVEILNPPEGQYDIWVASFNAGTFVPGNLYITELALDPSNAPAP